MCLFQSPIQPSDHSTSKTEALPRLGEVNRLLLLREIEPDELRLRLRAAFDHRDRALSRASELGAVDD